MGGLAVPRIRFGERVLREWAYGDAEVLREAAEDPYIPVITTVPREWSEEAGRAFVERQFRRAEDGTGYPFAIVDERGRTVGHVGVWIRDLDLGRVSIGYWVVASARGSGIAAAAVGTLAEWAGAHLGAARVELHIEPWNAGSVRTAEKAGFTCEGLLRSWGEVGGERRDMLMFARIVGSAARPAAS
ncbi:GNAT family N-acetyltransferase [Actinocorallia herbida]|uniref:GNAT family N-acetyltransferase n=1 Tax=Actinocorallia herbida TaxID=58109 RepID=UPI001FE6BD56|nr:GNAT family N-acetyltransferase [Actinocorallia herbida]